MEPTTFVMPRYPVCLLLEIKNQKTSVYWRHMLMPTNIYKLEPISNNNYNFEAYINYY